MKTEITELLGIEYPVIQGGMAWVADYHLAAAYPMRVALADRRRRCTGRVGKRTDPRDKKAD